MYRISFTCGNHDKRFVFNVFSVSKNVKGFVDGIHVSCLFAICLYIHNLFAFIGAGFVGQLGTVSVQCPTQLFTLGCKMLPTQLMMMYFR